MVRLSPDVVTPLLAPRNPHGTSRRFAPLSLPRPAGRLRRGGRDCAGGRVRGEAGCGGKPGAGGSRVQGEAGCGGKPGAGGSRVRGEAGCGGGRVWGEAGCGGRPSAGGGRVRGEAESGGGRQCACGGRPSAGGGRVGGRPAVCVRGRPGVCVRGRPGVCVCVCVCGCPGCVWLRPGACLRRRLGVRRPGAGEAGSVREAAGSSEARGTAASGWDRPAGSGAPPTLLQSRLASPR